MSDKKIIVRLSGGMGNQMHQYAFGLYLSEKIGCKLYVDKSFLKLNAKKLGITKRDFELDNFNISAEEHSFFLSNYYIFTLVKRIAFFRYFLLKICNVKIVDSNDCNRDFFSKAKIFYVNGVFGNISQYQFVKERIKKEFSPNPIIERLLNEVKSKISAQNSISVHIRRSDYLNPESVHEVLDVAYYYKAIDIMSAKLLKPSFYFFGDDPAWIEDNFDLSSNFFVNYKGNKAALFDFLAMANCKNSILSNSTFSWWAAYLNDNNDKIIVAPQRWLKAMPLNTDEIYPNDWIILN